jgi:Fucosyltransferase, N-terminal
MILFLVLVEVVYFNLNNEHVIGLSIAEIISTSTVELTSTTTSTFKLTSTPLTTLAPANGSMKTILVWNAYNRVEVKEFGYGHKPFAENCPVSNCMMTTDRRFVPTSQFDAILFNVPLLFNISPKFPAKTGRQPHQRYIFFSQESPAYNVEQLSVHEGVFNWTMSYQTFSDIPLLYGRYAPRTEADPPVSSWNTSKKTKLVAW